MGAREEEEDVVSMSGDCPRVILLVIIKYFRPEGVLD